MKKKFISIVALLLCLGLVICSCNDGSNEGESQVSVDDDNTSQGAQESIEEASQADSSSNSDFYEESIIEAITSEGSSSIESTPVFAQSKYYGMDTLNYVALGDSIARGYGLEKPEENCYPALLTHALSTVLDGTTVNYTNYAVDGMTTQGLVKLLNEGAKAVDSADLITICIGANNLLGSFLAVVQKHMPSLVNSSGELTEDQAQSSAFIDAVKAIQAEVESEEFAQLMEQGIKQLETDLAYIIDEINRRAPDADIIITTVYSPYNGIDLSLPYLGIDFDMGALSDRWVSALDEEIVRIVNEKNCVLVEAYAPFEEKQGLVNARLSVIPFDFNFDPHPNLKGHMELSNLHLNAVKNIK